MNTNIQPLSDGILRITDAQLKTLHALARLENLEEWMRDVRLYSYRFLPDAVSTRARDPQTRITEQYLSDVKQADFESRALAMLTDDQAMASFIRWRTRRADTVALPSLKTELGVSEYVSAIFAKVPA